MKTIKERDVYNEISKSRGKSKENKKENNDCFFFISYFFLIFEK